MRDTYILGRLRSALPLGGVGLSPLANVQVGMLARSALVLRKAEERAQGPLGRVGVLERGQALLARSAQGLATRVLELVLGWGQFLETGLDLLVVGVHVALVGVGVDLLLGLGQSFPGGGGLRGLLDGDDRAARSFDLVEVLHEEHVPGSAGTLGQDDGGDYHCRFVVPKEKDVVSCCTVPPIRSWEAASHVFVSPCHLQTTNK